MSYQPNTPPPNYNPNPQPNYPNQPAGQPQYNQPQPPQAGGYYNNPPAAPGSYYNNQPPPANGYYNQPAQNYNPNQPPPSYNNTLNRQAAPQNWQAQASTASNATVGGKPLPPLLMAAGGGILMLATFLPWVSVQGYSANGWSGEGFLVFLLGALLAAIGGFGLVNQGKDLVLGSVTIGLRQLGLASLIIGGIAAALMAYKFIHIGSSVAGSGASIGLGVFIGVLGAIVALAGGGLSWLKTK